MPVFTIKRNDRLPVINTKLFRSDGSIPNLTGATVHFKMGGTVNGVCDIVDVPTAEVEYAWGAGDTATSGNKRAEFQVTYPSGKTETFPNDGYVTVQILDDLG